MASDMFGVYTSLRELTSIDERRGLSGQTVCLTREQL
jgi:hypothetical protein